MVVAGIILKNVKWFNKIFMDSTALELKCFGHPMCFTITDPSGFFQTVLQQLPK